MKNSFKYLLLVLAGVAFFSCNPQEEKLPDLVTNTNPDMVKTLNPRAVPSPDDPNKIVFTMDNVDGLVGVWTIGSKSYARNKVEEYYYFPGEYEVSAFCYDKNGTYPAVKVQFSVEQQSPYACTNEDFINLTGGCEASETGGKTWVLDSTNKGYFGFGFDYSNEPDWWAADPGSHNGVYDDELTFILNADAVFHHETNGKSGIDSGEVDCAAYTSSWKISTEDGIKYLELTNGGFFPPKPGDQQNILQYEIIELTKDVLRVKFRFVNGDGSGQGYFWKLVPKQAAEEGEEN